MRDPGITAARSSFLCACAVLQGHFHPVVQAESVACLQQLHLFSPPDSQLEMASTAAVPPMLYRSLRSPHLVLRQAAVACLRQLAQREAKEVSNMSHWELQPVLNPTLVTLSSWPSLFISSNVSQCLSLLALRTCRLRHRSGEGQRPRGMLRCVKVMIYHHFISLSLQFKTQTADYPSFALTKVRGIRTAGNPFLHP